MVYILGLAVFVIAYPLVIWLTARGQPRLSPSKRQAVEEQQRSPAVRLRLFLPAFGAVLILVLWAAFGLASPSLVVSGANRCLGLLHLVEHARPAAVNRVCQLARDHAENRDSRAANDLPPLLE